MSFYKDSSYPQLVPADGLQALPTHIFPEAVLQPVSKENPPNATTTNNDTKYTNYSRWILIIFAGVVIALTAGLAGGFIGKSIESNNHKDDEKLIAAASNMGCFASAVSTTTRASSATPTSSFVKTVTSTKTTTLQPTATGIVVPTTGCSGKGNITGSTNAKIRYIGICDTDWIGNDIMALSSTTADDCINGCALYNLWPQITHCIGATFIPGLVNESLAMDEIGYPANCYLKNASNPQRAYREMVTFMLVD